MSRSTTSHSGTQPVKAKPAHRPRSRRIRGLDGIRAVAASAVLGYHLFPSVVKGGFLGVDVFFVLSGFLITALLIREYDHTGGIALGQFWLRRVRRLLPAVALMATVTLLVAGFLSEDLLAGIGLQFAAVVTFLYNWVEIWRGASYFDHANPRLWTNVWSLAVEQQFYLIWPLIVVVTMLLQRHWRWVIPLVLALASSSWMAYLIIGSTDFTRAYQGSDSHAFGLMLGATVAFLSPYALSAKYPRIRWLDAFFRGFFAWLGLLAVGVSFFLIPDNQAWVFPWGTLLVCLATLGVIQGVLPTVDGRMGPGRGLAAVLDTAPLRWVGERSYGIYLWHWPVWVILTHKFPTLHPGWVALVVVSVSVVAAALSFRYVETPMRRHGIANTFQSWLGRPWERAQRQDNTALAWLRLLTPVGVSILVVGTMAGMIASAPTQTSAQRLVEAGRQALNDSSASPATAAPTDQPKAGQPTVTPSSAMTPTPTPTPAFAVPPTGENVTVIGDSVTLASALALQEKLPQISIDADVSRSIIAGTQILRDQIAAGTCRPYVVLGLTTNTMLVPEQLEEVLELVGPDRRLILVTGFGPARDDWIFDSNEVIHEFVKAHPERVAIADWAGAIEPHTEHLASDFVHPDQDGGAIYAQVIKAALEEFQKPVAAPAR